MILKTEPNKVKTLDIFNLYWRVMEGMAVAIRSDPLYYAERPWVAGSIRRSQKPIRYMKGVPGSSETKFSNIPFAPSDKKNPLWRIRIIIFWPHFANSNPDPESRGQVFGCEGLRNKNQFNFTERSRSDAPKTPQKSV